MRLTWFADVLRAAGLTVVEADGWKERGYEYAATPLGVICHETQGSATSTVQGELGVLINGRTGLPGPIAQLMIDRKGVWYVVASGRCNQVKTGWAGPLEGKGNSYSFGIEAMHGVSEDWANKPAQYRSYVTGVAAICERMQWQPDGHVIGHKEHQPGDKSDPEFSMSAFRQAVAAEMEDDMLPEDPWNKVHWGTQSAGKRLEIASVGNGAKLDQLITAAAADEARDKAALAAIQALAAPGGVDADRVINAVNAVRDQLGTEIGQLRAALAATEAERDALNDRLADALAGDAPTS